MTAGQSAEVAVHGDQRQTATLVSTLVDFGSRIRGRHLLVGDVVATALAIWLALSLRFDQPLSLGEVALYLPAAALPLLIRPIVNERLGLYRRLWRDASVPELTQILWAAVSGTVICMIVYFGLLSPLGAVGPGGFPRAFWIGELIVSLALIGGSRFMIRAIGELRVAEPVEPGTVVQTPALLFGAGRTGSQMARAALRDPRGGVRPVGFLDENPARWGAAVAGLQVLGGVERMEEAVRRTGARMVLITMPAASGSSVRRVIDGALAAGLDVRRVPPMHEMLDGSIDALRVRRVRFEDLLGRQPVTEHAPEVAAAIRGKVAMVTGAGGSIGSELARQVYAMGPSKLVLVDRSESSLYMIQRELELRRESGRGSGELSVHLANVASRAVIGRLVNGTRPSVIFHAAACKHVPMMEEHPSEGVQVNVGGTMSVLAAAVEAGVPRFVLVSTDKAVEPSSVMGATKRLAEWLVADAARRTGLPYVSVRFGNVLGSAGSVLPILQAQLEDGEPLTLTDPGMTRYFMTIKEAGWLILDAGAIGKPGDLFVLDMGEPVKITDVIRDLIRLAGRDPETVPIRITGLRPGEKLHERLFYKSETVERTGVEKILRVKDAEPPANIRNRAQELIQYAFGDRDDELRRALFAAVSAEVPSETPAPDKAAANAHAGSYDGAPVSRTFVRSRRGEPLQDSTAVH
jgi:FlaA1/EpsC-like NDP-sugar epimerase